MKKIELSIIIPCFNEQDSIYEVYLEVQEIMIINHIKYEIIFVNDGSTDGTITILDIITKSNKNVRVLNFNKNFGQTSAMYAGFSQAKGSIIITMDSDLQNVPSDIPILMMKIREGYDLVCGWRTKRKDVYLKRFFSEIARVIRKSIIDDDVHDSGCSLKAYKSEVIKSFTLYGDMHRFLPALFKSRGYRICEVPVKHRDRRYGITKYNSTRLLRGFFDLMLIKYWNSYGNSPIYFFGYTSLISGTIGFLLCIYLVFIKLFYKIGIGNRPLLLLGILLIILAVQCMFFGLISDMLVKTYFKDNKPNFTEIRKGVF